MGQSRRIAYRERGRFLIMATLGGTSLGTPLTGPPDFLGGDELETGLGNLKPSASASMLRYLRFLLCMKRSPHSVPPFQGLEYFWERFTQGVARRLALPWAILFRAFSPCGWSLEQLNRIIDARLP
jgi:hypothetical protein